MNQDNRINLIEEMLQNNPDDSFLNYAAALEYKKRGDVPRSISLLERIVNMDPNYLGAYYQLGKIYEEENRTEDAVKIYKQGREIAKEKNDQKTLSELSEALLILDEDDGEFW